MAPPSSILFLLMVLVISPHHHLQANSQYNSSFERSILSSLNQHWGYPVSLYEAWHSNSSSSHCNWPYVVCNDDHMVTRLSLSGTYISGTIPSSICQLKHLVSIDLSWNKLSGAIPAGIGNCTSLQELDQSENQLSGTIPGEIFLLENLVTLSLRDNTLHGIIPTTIEKAVSLEHLDLSNNPNLNGSIPDGITHLHNLLHLDLSFNSFSGEIPTRMFSLRGLRSLLLGYNKLSGPIMKIILGEMNKTDNHGHALTTVNLCGNAFSGMVPYKFWNEYYRGSCLDSSNICSEEGTTDPSLPSCPSSLCSYVIFQGYKMCTAGYRHKKSYTHINSYDVIIIILGITAIGAMGFALLCYLARKCMKNRNWGSARALLHAPPLPYTHHSQGHQIQQYSTRLRVQCEDSRLWTRKAAQQER